MTLPALEPLNMMNAKQTTGYYREACNRLAPFYDPLVRFLALFIGGEEQFRQQIVALASLRPGEYVLDVACGTGTTATMMAQCVGSEGRVVGIDLSPRMIEIAKRKTTQPQLTFCQANAEDIPYPGEYFDVGTIVYALHEMPRAARQNVLNETRRVLKPGGRLVVVDIHEPYNWLRHAIFRLLMLMESATARDLLKSGLLKEIEAAGFDDIRQVFIVRDFIPVTLAVKNKSEVLRA